MGEGALNQRREAALARSRDSKCAAPGQD